MIEFDITAPDQAIGKELQHKIDQKTKPIGALGQLEEIGLKIGTIQQSLTPTLVKPTIVVFAGDHGIAKDGLVNPYPQEVTAQMVYNFLNEGAAINVFCKTNELDLKIVDAGVNHDFENAPGLIDAKVAYGTKNYLQEPAMSQVEFESALHKGSDIVQGIHEQGTNIIGFGEMGIGNTSSASLLMHCLAGIPLDQSVGRGTGLDDVGLNRKLETLEKAMKKYGKKVLASDALMTYGGFEIVMMVGAMLKAAELKMIILVDGFICTAAILAASKIAPKVLEYCVFAHTSEEKGHQRLLDYLSAEPILSLGMRLGEGTGAALSYPIIKNAVAFLNEMASFESAEVSQSTT